MKPIIFGTESVRAILDGRKSVTRRAIKFPEGQTGRLPSNGARDHLFYPGGIKYPPYQTGSIMYAREAWANVMGQYLYRADFKNGVEWPWRPSIHMPKEAARIFLRVTGVKVERLQEITEEQAEAEGCGALIRSARYNFASLWDSTVKKADLPRYGWDASPWVWVIAFERISKEEASGKPRKELKSDD